MLKKIFRPIIINPAPKEINRRPNSLAVVSSQAWLHIALSLEQC